MTHKSTAKIAVGLTATLAFFVIGAFAARIGIVNPRHAFDVVSAAFLQGYHAAPALILVMALAILLLLAVGTGAATRSVLNVLRRNARGIANPEDEADAESPDMSASEAGQAYVDGQIDDRDVRYALLGDMLRIGRDDDNDIRIPSDAVDHYHAAIYREDYDDWHVTEIGSAPGTGLLVNGRRCGDARLRDGDVIQLGGARLRFHAPYA